MMKAIRIASTSISIVLLSCQILLGQGGTWTTEAPLPSRIVEAASGVIGCKLYVVGGFGAVDRLSSTLAYDPVTNTWEARTPMPAVRNEAVGAVVDGMLYIIGGFDSQGYAVGAVEAYNPRTDTWSEKAPMPTPRWRAAAGVVDGLIYVAGGFDEYAEDLTTLIVYDPKTDNWITKAPEPTGGGGAASAVIVGVLYVAGGLHVGPGATSLRTVQAYDPRTNSWSTKTPAPFEFDSAVSGGIDGKLYVAGGSNVSQSGGFAVKNTLLAYDPSSDSWLLAPSMPTARFSAGGGVIDDALYVAGGEGDKFSFPLVNEAFSPYLSVTIRVNPTSINLKSNGKIDAVILSWNTFDATSVNPETVTLAGASVVTEENGTPVFTFDDVNGDGILDLIVHFRARDLQLTNTDTQVVLKGQTFGGQLIKGVALIRIVPQ